jgi:hypothetical protein
MYPQHWLFVFGGTYSGASETGEIWQCGIRCQPAAGSAHTFGDEDAVLTALATPFNAWYILAAHSMRPDAKLAFLKLNEIAPDGTYADTTTTHQYDYATPAPGQGAASLPSILTLCWSWTTARQRGIASKGRIYPPTAIAVTSGAARVTSTVQNTNLTAAKAMLDVMSRPNGVDFEIAPCVVSKGTHNGTGTGASEDITGVRIGDVVDVQRRRKNALVETYVAGVWP